MSKNPVVVIATILVVIGGLNWGLVVFDYNLVTELLGTGTGADVVYGVVGLSSLVVLGALLMSFSSKE